MSFDIEDWARASLRVSGECAGHDDGHRELVAECPFCGRADKLWINAEKRKWTCYYCSEGGSLALLVAKVEGVSVREATERILLEERGPVELQRLQSMLSVLPYEESVSTPAPYPLPPGFVPVWDGRTQRWSVPTYLWEKREIQARTARAYGIGYCEEGRWAGRLVLPLYRCGLYQGFTTRAVNDALTPKYLTAPGLDKSHLLYGYDQVFLREHVCLVEGPFDVLSMSQRGFPAVGLMGKGLTSAHIHLLRASCVKRATILLDGNDETAPLAACKAAIKATGYFEDVRVGWLPEGLDPATTSTEALQRCLAAAHYPTPAEILDAEQRAAAARRRRSDLDRLRQDSSMFLSWMDAVATSAIV